MKKAMNITSWILVILLTGSLVGFVADQKSHVLCKAVDINIDHSGHIYFIRKDDVQQIISEEAGTLINRPMAAIDANRLETVLNMNPFIADAQVFTTIDGCVMIVVKQRQPLARLAGKFNKGYYLDTGGVVMPLSAAFTALTMVVSGELDLSFYSGYSVTKIKQDNAEHNLLKNIYELASFINNNAFWKAQIIQVQVTQGGEFELIPRVGSHKILFGTASNMHDKFSKLLTFYKEGLNATGWNHYKTINLKYHHQIICTKNLSL